MVHIRRLANIMYLHIFGLNSFVARGRQAVLRLSKWSNIKMATTQSAEELMLQLKGFSRKRWLRRLITLKMKIGTVQRNLCWSKFDLQLIWNPSSSWGFYIWQVFCTKKLLFNLVHVGPEAEDFFIRLLILFLFHIYKSWTGSRCRRPALQFIPT